MTINTDFWTKRVKKFGHTGWNDPIIYLYDQSARLLAIEKIIVSLDCEKNQSLDFGCGTGDFSYLLCKYFKKVMGLDVCEYLIIKNRVAYSDNNIIAFFSIKNFEDCKIPEKSINTILSITVLDHILSDIELLNTISHFHKILSDDGYLIILEYSSINSVNEKSSYQKFRTLGQWEDLFSTHDFEIKKRYQFYHPTMQPCESYLQYRKDLNVFFSFFIRLFQKNQFFSSRIKNYIIKKYLKNDDFFWDASGKESPLKILILRKRSHS
ncbi:MAG: class I SAM-dependent methyltransferase [Methanoregula sp.]